ncbi:winged helix-turn-helix domain-containing protein [Roseococcus sp. SDR]|uniref:MarR family transcriptional regulator n=1 Tax=Roseococcus sp. SDR TaxID=2835532 RepID=UPI001BD04774|nr:MarR family transcriptional regulator [Roseococcus sp. SDR]MBV1844795.1 winged helix-turn-helix domain-containing protein [Roseococcus sp. SDR]
MQQPAWKVRELRVLRLVKGNPGASLTDLARLTRFERSAAAQILMRLIETGLARCVG